MTNPISPGALRAAKEIAITFELEGPHQSVEQLIAEQIEKFSGLSELLEACRTAISTIHGLVDQQAMPDEWWIASVEQINSALKKSEGTI